MSVTQRNPRTYQNRNPLVTKAQEMLAGSQKAQRRELIAQQELILLQQIRHAKQKRSTKLRKPETVVPEPYMNGLDAPEDVEVGQSMTGRRIFVSCASYRDPELVLTVQDLFAKADHPENLVVGVYEQNDPETDKEFTLSKLLESATMHALSPYYANDQLRVMFSPATDAKGPMYARALIEQHLFGNEDYYMIIDSHAQFVAGWDTICLDEWARASANSPNKVVLSYFPSNFDRTKRHTTPLQENPSLKMDYLRMLKFDKNCGFPMPTEQPFKNMPREPIRSLFWTACFSFASSSMIRDVPFRSEFPYLFLGEEIFTNMRLFTHGYDVYSPSKHILFHIKNRDYRATFWELFYNDITPRNASFTVSDDERKQRKAVHLDSIKRLSTLMNNYDGKEVGPARSYQDFCDFIGLDFVKQQVKEHCVFGRTKQPSKEEQYAKMTENTAAPSKAPRTALLPMPPRSSKTPFNKKPQHQPWLRSTQKPQPNAQSGMMTNPKFNPLQRRR